ncbi:MAG: hypothetical protein HQ530_02835 [Parcubacteria group bacterium]|nr:hypothetical protein [Parcubacteria group bacterium]
MTPLQTFHEFAKMLSIKPLEFWPETDRTQLIERSAAALAEQKSVLEQKELKDTLAYQKLLALEKSISSTDFNEVEFTQSFDNLLEVYRHSTDEDFIESLDEMDSTASQAKQKTLEHHVSLEQLHKKERKMSEEEKVAGDLETMQKIGVFYVLEYTLQVLHEFTYIPDEDKKKLLEQGLKTEAGNLPAYLPLEDTFRKDLCYQIHDQELRHTLLESFYKYEEVCYNEKMQEIGNALKEFNLSLLNAFQAKGLETFQAAVYSPFGNNLPLVELIQQVESMDV